MRAVGCGRPGCVRWVRLPRWGRQICGVADRHMSRRVRSRRDLLNVWKAPFLNHHPIAHGRKVTAPGCPVSQFSSDLSEDLSSLDRDRVHRPLLGRHAAHDIWTNTATDSAGGQIVLR